MQTGIYQITNIKNGKYYIGSAINIEKRWSNHKNCLQKNIHSNIKLQRSWNKNESDSFEFSILEECLVDKLRDREQVYLDKHVGNPNCFNIAKNAKCSSRGIKQSKKTIRKRSKALKGRELSEDHKLKIGLANKGNIIGEIGRRNMSLAHTGKVLPVSQKEKISRALQGENGPIAKLHEYQVLEIREKRKTGKSYAKIANEYNVDKKTIINIVLKRTWTYL